MGFIHALAAPQAGERARSGDRLVPGTLLSAVDRDITRGDQPGHGQHHECRAGHPAHTSARTTTATTTQMELEQLLDTVSFYDAYESFYHGFLLALLS